LNARAYVWALLAVFATALRPVHASEPHWPASLTIATASSGGTYHAYGSVLAGILTRALDLPVTERTTEGPSENIRLIESGEAQIGFVTMGAALQGWNGSGDWTEGRTYRSMRAAFPMYDTPFHFVVAKDSPIRTVADLAGRRVGVGPAGGTAGSYMPQVFATLGINSSLAYGSWDEMAQQLEAGSIDAIAAAAGAPFPAIAALERKKQVRFVPVSRDEAVALRLSIPELTSVEIPAGTYPSLRRPYPTVGLYNFAVVRQDLPNDLVFRIVEAAFANRDQLMAASPAAAATLPANFVHNTFLPYHDGASRYYATRMIPGVVRGD
jgi:TRAP transporter TAXI family solute receptor